MVLYLHFYWIRYCLLLFSKRSHWRVFTSEHLVWYLTVFMLMHFGWYQNNTALQCPACICSEKHILNLKYMSLSLILSKLLTIPFLHCPTQKSLNRWDKRWLKNISKYLTVKPLFLPAWMQTIVPKFEKLLNYLQNDTGLKWKSKWKRHKLVSYSFSYYPPVETTDGFWHYVGAQ